MFLQRGFWVKGGNSYVDIRVFNPSQISPIIPQSCQNLNAIHRKNECEKKNKYNARVIQVEHGTFTPLVFSCFGGMGFECTRFYQRLSELIAEKRNINFSVASCWIRTKLSFSLLRSTLLCIRGSRSIQKNYEIEKLAAIDILAALNESKLR